MVEKSHEVEPRFVVGQPKFQQRWSHRLFSATQCRSLLESAGLLVKRQDKRIFSI